jgi:hypothetical protein
MRFQIIQSDVLSPENISNLCFVTFANKSYMKTDRIAKQVEELGMFDRITQLNDDDIREYIEKHSDFIKAHRPGFGLWIWKPKVIYDTLNRMNDGDILVYCDAGMYVNKEGKDRLRFYISKLDKYDMVTFSASDRYKAQEFVKNDAIMAYHPAFNDEWTTMCYAGIMIVKKTTMSMNLIRDWLGLCENHHFIDKSNSVTCKDLPHYCGNDCDNGLFNLCLSKYHDVVCKIHPDEINLYLSDGRQIAHDDRVIQKEVDWSSLDRVPFQVRRMTPKFGY